MTLSRSVIAVLAALALPAFEGLTRLVLAAPPQSQTTQTPTQAAPTTSSTDGVSISPGGANVAGVRLTVCATQPLDGGTALLGGSGTMYAYQYFPGILDGGVWARGPSGVWPAGLDFSVSEMSRCQVFPEVDGQVALSGERIQWVASTVTFDGGSVLPDGGYTLQARIDTCYPRLPNGGSGCQ